MVKTNTATKVALGVAFAASAAFAAVSLNDMMDQGKGGKQLPSYGGTMSREACLESCNDAYNACLLDGTVDACLPALSVCRDACAKYPAKTPGYMDPGTGMPGGYAAPGYEVPGYVAPGYEAPGYVAPGYVAPGYTTSGDATPGYMPVPQEMGTPDVKPAPGKTDMVPPPEPVKYFPPENRPLPSYPQPNDNPPDPVTYEKPANQPSNAPDAYVKPIPDGAVYKK